MKQYIFSSYKQLILLLLFLASLDISAQTALRTKKTVLTSSEIKFDTLSIIPNSFSAKILNQSIPSSDYKINFFTSTIIFTDSSYLDKEITLDYQVFNFDLSKPFTKRDKKSIEKQQFSASNDFKAPTSNFSNPWLENSSDLSKSGSITRGISIGNRQDVVVNSDLNLQLDGNIFENFKIKAVISDKNIPLQPEGNTQQIQEFDKVFIQLYNQKTKITAGDFDISSPMSAFLKTNKKVLGTQAEFTYNLPDSSIFTTTTSVAITKGKFARINVTPIDGNQGPYRLTNENGDANIIIIGGSERVFIDGMLLVRGQNNEYTIDYNLGELIFTSKKLISREAKIVVEFEYTDRHYSRTLVSSFNQWQNSKIKVGFNVYSEQDMKNQSIQPELNNEQKAILRNAGNQFDLMTSPAFDSLSFNSNQVRYKMVDTLVSGISYDSVFVYSTNADSAFYALSFTYMGENKGDYVLLNNTVNGRVFSWIAPQGGVPRGSYSPIYILVPPQKKQMVLGKIEYQISKKSTLNIEIAFSNFEKNTFASNTAPKNYGGAINTQYTNKQTFKTSDSLKKSTLTTKILHQFIAKSFSEIEPSKNSEFFRRFNLKTNQLSAEDLNIISYDIIFEHPKNGFANYTFNYLNYKNQFQGTQNSWSGLWRKKYFDITTIGTNTNGQGFDMKSNYFKQTHTARAKTKYGYMGITLDGENNLAKTVITDSLNIGSFVLQKYELFIQNVDSAKTKYKLWHNNKELSIPLLNKINHFSNTTEHGGNLVFQNKNNSVDVNGIYREATYSNSFPDKNDYSFTANINHQSNLFKGALVISTYYQTANGREQKREYQYIKVSKGQGQYIWTDFNNNNVEDLDEFSTTPYSDQGEYIKVWLQSTEYIKTIVNEYNQTLLINPGSLLKKKTKLTKLISLFKNQTSLFTNNKTTAGPEIGSNPFNSNDDQNITANKSIRNNLYINQSNPIWNLEYIYNDQYNKLFLANGFENKSNKSNAIILRSSMLKKISLKIDGGLSNRSTGSELLINRNYKIDNKYIETSVSYLRSTNFRTSVSYRYTEKHATITSSKQTSFFNQANADIQINIPKKGMISSKISCINVLYNGETNNPLAIEILEGLSNGLNVIYNFSLQTILSKNIQLNANYELRVSPQKTVVHVGNIAIRAFF